MKNGIDYFPLDVALDDKFDLIEAEFGMNGFAVVIKLLQKIYGGCGYYCEWNHEVALLFAKKACFQLSVQQVSKIITACVARGIFHQELFDTYGILTSRGIQKRYFEAASRRKSLEADSRFLLINLKKYAKGTEIIMLNENRKNADIPAKNVDISPKNENILKQSKEKKTKEEKSKEQGALPFGEFGNVLLSAIDHKKLTDRLGAATAEEYISRLDSYIASTGKQYKNHCAVILRWQRDDEQKKTEKSEKVSHSPVYDYDFDTLTSIATSRLVGNSQNEKEDSHENH